MVVRPQEHLESEAFSKKLLNGEAEDATIGQAIKGARGMPWHQEPMKDVTSCDKLRVGANSH